jgi:hypothetical protein
VLSDRPCYALEIKLVYKRHRSNNTLSTWWFYILSRMNNRCVNVAHFIVLVYALWISFIWRGPYLTDYCFLPDSTKNTGILCVPFGSSSSVGVSSLQTTNSHTKRQAYCFAFLCLI